MSFEQKGTMKPQGHSEQGSTLQAVPLILVQQVTKYFQPTITEGWQ